MILENIWDSRPIRKVRLWIKVGSMLAWFFGMATAVIIILVGLVLMAGIF